MDWFYWLFPPIMTALPLAMVWGSDYILPPAPKTSFRRWGLVLLPVAILSVIAAYLSGGLEPISEKAEPDPYKLSAEERSLLALLGKAA